jgi:hypothetical protein
MVRVRLSPSSALFLLNVKKRDLFILERDYKVSLFIYADGRLRGDEYELEIETHKASQSRIARLPPNETLSSSRSTVTTRIGIRNGIRPKRGTPRKRSTKSLPQR